MFRRQMFPRLFKITILLDQIFGFPILLQCSGKGYRSTACSDAIHIVWTQSCTFRNVHVQHRIRRWILVAWQWAEYKTNGTIPLMPTHKPIPWWECNCLRTKTHSTEEANQNHRICLTSFVFDRSLYISAAVWNTKHFITIWISYCTNLALV